jgi:hypothetical protein
MKHLNKPPFTKEEVEKPYKFRGDIIEKIFEEISKLKNDDFYVKDNQRRQIDDYLTDINKEKIIIDKIKKYFPYKISSPLVSNNDFSIRNIISVLCVDYLDRFLKLRIFEIKDEYFIADVYTFKDGVTYNKVYFKCDQIEGLFALLYDIKKILDEA